MPKSKNRRKSKGSSTQGTTSAPEMGETVKSASGAAATIPGDAAEPKAKSKGVSPLQFFRQVRDEAQKVTWTSRNETLVSTIMVMIMVVIASLFFFMVDQVLRWIVPNILSISL